MKDSVVYTSVSPNAFARSSYDPIPVNITDDELLARLRAMPYDSEGTWRDDPEAGHSDADDLLREVLINLGFTKSMEYYSSQVKWYS
jgi:hypothetical protein